MRLLKSAFLIFGVFILVVFNLHVNTMAKEMSGSNCRNCHGEIYRKAINSPYQHRIVVDGCVICHRENQPGEEDFSTNELKLTINTPVSLKAFIIHIRHLKKDKRYKMEVLLEDEYGNTTRTVRNEVIPEKLPDLTGKIGTLNVISDVQVREVKKGPYVKAVLTWHTDAPATTSAEYMLKDSKGRPYFRSYRDLYSWDHKIELNRLRHKSIYSFRAKSEGLLGKSLTSKETTVDTSREIKSPDTTESSQPVVNKLKAFRIRGQDGLFLWVEADRPAYCNVRIEEIKEKTSKPMHKIRIDKYTTIDVCKGCHSFSVSHPVGMRAEGEHVRTPTDLPTIDNGIITCTSCHDPHGSKNPFLARIDFKADLCLKCHDNTIYRR